MGVAGHTFRARLETASALISTPWWLWKRRRFRNELRPDDVLIVGYPRSGNTWLAFMIANALATEGGVTLPELDRVIPDVNTEYFWGKRSIKSYSRLRSPRFFRIHALYDSAFPRVVYVLRDPRDTLVSQYHLLRFERGEVGATLREFLLDHSRFPSEWDAHVSGWALRDDPRILVVRYEEMHAHPERALAQVLEFAGVPQSEDTVSRAAAASRFDRMRALDDSSRRELGEPAAEDEKRVRRGKIGGWREEIDLDIVAGLEERYGAVMDLVGYERVAT